MNEIITLSVEKEKHRFAMSTVDSGDRYIKKIDSDEGALPSHRNALLASEISTQEFEKSLRTKDKQIVLLKLENQRLQ
jgi:hypothetical protein